MRWYLATLLMFISSGSFAGPPSFCTVEHSAVSCLICADEELWTADAEVFWRVQRVAIKRRGSG